MMRRLSLILVAVFVAFANINGAAEAPIEDREIEAVAKEFAKAFTEGDTPKMQRYFADSVVVERGPVSGLQKKEQLCDAYAKMIAQKVGLKKWKELFKNVQPTLSQAAAEGELFEFVKAGDYIYDLHFRESIKGKRGPRWDELDEAVIFVFRRVDGEYKVVGHFADY